MKEARFEPRSGAPYRGLRHYGAGRWLVDRRAQCGRSAGCWVIGRPPRNLRRIERLLAALAQPAGEPLGPPPDLEITDPLNPSTGGGPIGFRAFGGSNGIRLRWNPAPARADLLGAHLLLGDLAPLLGITGDPVIARTSRWRNAGGPEAGLTAHCGFCRRTFGICRFLQRQLGPGGRHALRTTSQW